MKKAAAACLLILSLSLAACSAPGARDPDVRIVDLKGLEDALAAYRGKAVLLDFWAIWCEPCVAELPEILRTGREYRARGGEVVTVSFDLMIPGVTRDEVMQQMRAFVAERGIDAPVLIYDAADYDAINERFGLPGPIPVTLALDRNGAVVDRQEGAGTGPRFSSMIEKALQ